MKRVISVVIVNILIISAVYCFDNITAGELPKEIVDQIKHLQTYPTENLKPDCQKLQDVQVDFILYQRDASNPIILDPLNPKDIDPNKKLILLIHGWLQDSNSSGILKLKSAYLERYDANIIIFDWSQIAKQVYTTTYCHMQRISVQISKFLCHISSEMNVALNEVHVVGFSLGGQLAGVSAQYVKTKCKKQIGRITGLDPAGPLFRNLPTRRRLDKTDAIFVDVIHTDQMKFGYSGNIGHSDFYPNCGQMQPGCTTVKDIVDSSLLTDIMCSHHRSIDYMIESIASDDFVGVSCGMCPRFCRPDIISETYTIMGEGASGQNRNKFYLTTKNVPPYGEGWTLSGAKLP